MKRISIAALLAFVALSLIAGPVDAGRHSGGSRKKGPKRIQVRQLQVKSAPNYLSSTMGTLHYGAEVEVVSEEGNWYRIAAPAGYIPKNAVGRSTASVDSSPQYAARGVTHDETALAGKGFNPQVEGQYKRSSQSLAAAYRQVDRVEAIKVSDAALRSFIAQGKLNQ